MAQHLRLRNCKIDFRSSATKIPSAKPIAQDTRSMLKVLKVILKLGVCGFLKQIPEFIKGRVIKQGGFKVIC